MTSYVCSQLSTTMPQTCESWVVQENILDQLAITKADAYELCASIALMFAIAFIFSKLRSTI